MPVQCSLFVYGYAKMKLLDFAYGFVKKFLRPNSYQLTCCDTDSLYFGLSENTIDEAVKPEMRKHFYEDYDKWFPTPACEKHKRNFVNTKVNGENWTPAQCCLDSFKFQKRTHGLFKEEFRR